MFSKDVRNKRILTASVRAARASAVAVRAEKAIERRDAAKREVEWLRNAPVKDGAAGADLPSDEDIKAYVSERVPNVPADADDDDADVPSDEPGTGALFSE